jgi:hypothetical protein
LGICSITRIPKPSCLIDGEPSAVSETITGAACNERTVASPPIWVRISRSLLFFAVALTGAYESESFLTRSVIGY